MKYFSSLGSHVGYRLSNSTTSIHPIWIVICGDSVPRSRGVVRKLSTTRGVLRALSSSSPKCITIVVISARRTEGYAQYEQWFPTQSLSRTTGTLNFQETGHRPWEMPPATATPNLELILEHVYSPATPHIPNGRVALIGFSKGCIVTTRILREIALYGGHILPRLVSVYYLDAGTQLPIHIEPPIHLYPDLVVCGALSKTNRHIYFDIRVTPFQQRFALDAELFHQVLLRNGMACSLREYGKSSTYETHFRILLTLADISDCPNSYRSGSPDTE